VNTGVNTNVNMGVHIVGCECRAAAECARRHEEDDTEESEDGLG
jgi:hypothetical protein